jgi:hypothetical protein
MMYGREKSDLVIVAMKPAKAPGKGAIHGGRSRLSRVWSCATFPCLKVSQGGA